jgi:YHS domain-containing protein
MRSRLSRRDVIGPALLVAACSVALPLGSAGAQQVPLAIKGYDPVAYFTDGRPVRGQPDIEYEWDDDRYWFSNAEHRDLFKADPARYAPQFGNFCAMALSKGELVEANPENWLITDGKLYIFGKPEGPKLFQKDLAGSVTKANQNRSLVPGN